MGFKCQGQCLRKDKEYKGLYLHREFLDTKAHLGPHGLDWIVNIRSKGPFEKLFNTVHVHISGMHNYEGCHNLAGKLVGNFLSP